MGIGEDVKDRLHIVVIGDRRTESSVDAREIVQHLRSRRDSESRISLNASRSSTGYWNAVQAVDRVHLVLRGLHHDRVVDTILRIQPVVGGGLAATRESVEHAVGHAARGQSDRLSAAAVDIHAKLRSIDHLVDVDVCGAGNRRHFLPDLLAIS